MYSFTKSKKEEFTMFYILLKPVKRSINRTVSIVRIKPQNYRPNLKSCVLSIMLLTGFSMFAKSDTNKFSSLFLQENPKAQYTIEYDDLNSLLNRLVTNVKFKKRKNSRRREAQVGTLLYTNKVPSVFNANQFDYDIFRKKPANIEILNELIQDLQSLPNDIALSEFKGNSQLAYWLNLYNIALVREITKIYIDGKFEIDLYSDNSILDKPILTVSGIKLSLNDIQFKIVYPKFKNNPILMYGFYQGVVGGPDLLNKAYTGENVYSLLELNAKAFVNSNRSNYKTSKTVLRVSNIYEHNDSLFPDFKNSLKKHLAKFISAKYKTRIEESRFIKPVIVLNQIAGNNKKLDELMKRHINGHSNTVTKVL